MREGTIYAIIYALMWIVLFLRLCKHFRENQTTIFVTSFYVLYSVLAIFLYNSLNSYRFNDVVLIPYIYLFIMILLSLAPIISYDHSCVKGLVRPPEIWVDSFAYFCIICAILAFPGTISELKSGIILLISNSSGGASLYADAHGGIIKEKTLLDVPGYFLSIVSYISIFIFFYYLTIPRLKKTVIIGFSLTMLYSLLRPVSLGLRTDTVMTIFAFVAGYVIMYKWISPKRKKILIWISAIIGTLVVALIMIISISRFEKQESGVGGTNLYYIAHSSIYFNNYALDANGIRHGDRTCRVFKELLGFENVPNGIIERRFMYRNMHLSDNVFSTFVGDFTLDFGPIFAFIIFLLYAISFSRITRTNNHIITFSKLLIVYLTVLIPLQGGMYLFTFSDGGNYTLLAFALMVLFLKWDKNRTNQIVWA